MHERLLLAYEDYNSKYVRRYDQKYMIHDRITRVCGLATYGVDMAKLRLVSSHGCAFQPEQRQELIKRECQELQKRWGSRCLEQWREPQRVLWLAHSATSLRLQAD